MQRANIQSTLDPRTAGGASARLRHGTPYPVTQKSFGFCFLWMNGHSRIRNNPGMIDHSKMSNHRKMSNHLRMSNHPWMSDHPGSPRQLNPHNTSRLSARSNLWGVTPISGRNGHGQPIANEQSSAGEQSSAYERSFATRGQVEVAKTSEAGVTRFQILVTRDAAGRRWYSNLERMFSATSRAAATMAATERGTRIREFRSRIPWGTVWGNSYRTLRVTATGKRTVPIFGYQNSSSQLTKGTTMPAAPARRDALNHIMRPSNSGRPHEAF